MKIKKRGRKRSVSSNAETDKVESDELNGDVPHSDSDRVKLKREVGLISAVCLMVGTMIGSGIFVSPAGVLKQTGSVGMSLVVWFLCGVIATLGSLCYAELGTVIPKSGGEYSYILTAFDEPLASPLAFLTAWVSILLVRPSGLAIISLGFAEYAAAPFFSDGDCGAPETIKKLLAALCVIIVVFINSASVRFATSVQNFFTATKLLALTIIIVVGIMKLVEGNTQYLDPSVSFKGSATNVATYGIAFYQGLWAYDGWNQLNYITEELVNPYRNLPLALLIGLPLVTVVYLLVNISYFTVMSPQELLQSNAVAVTFGDRTLGVMAWIMPFAVACSTFGSANGTMFTAGRLAYVAARSGHMVEVLSMVHVRRYTPSPSLIFTGVLSIIMLIPNGIDALVNYFSFTAWLSYGLTITSLLYYRYKRPDAYRPIKVPLVIPILILLVAIYLVIAPIIDEPDLGYLYAFLITLAGLFLYYPLVHYKKTPGCMNYVTLFFQLFLEVGPTSENLLEHMEEPKDEDKKALTESS